MVADRFHLRIFFRLPDICFGQVHNGTKRRSLEGVPEKEEEEEKEEDEVSEEWKPDVQDRLPGLVYQGERFAR